MPGDPLFFYFAWVDEGTAFNAAVHATVATKVWDGSEGGGEGILSLKIAQEEGEFASLEIDVLNTGAGLLAPGRKQWCWLSWFDGADILPLFTGHLIAVPGQISGEVMRLLFRAKPLDFDTQKSALADTLKVLPWYDPVWIATDTDDPDTAIETRGALWHIDRTTLDVTVSDELEGEDGTISAGESDHFYDNLEISCAASTKKAVHYKAELAWTQSGQGTIDVTGGIYTIFRQQLSIYVAPPISGIISTLTGDGLKGDWPKGGTTFGGGWSVNNDTSIADADPRIFAPYTYDVTYQGLSPDWDPADANLARVFLRGFAEYIVKFPVSALKQSTKFDWQADRKRIETIEFTLVADIQPLSDDPSGDETTETISVSASDTVTEPDGAGDMPIADKRRPTYVPSERGQRSLYNRLLHARAILRRGARAVEIKFRMPWVLGIGATLRKNVDIADHRLPGGAANGKIISYEMIANASDGAYCDITIGCAIGRGGAAIGAAGDPSYVEDGYVDPGYLDRIGAILLVGGDIPLHGFASVIIDDDGVRLTDLNENNAVQSLTLTGGLKDQVETVTGAPDPVEALKTVPSRVCIQLRPVAGQSFHSTYNPEIDPLTIPKMIDLELV